MQIELIVSCESGVRFDHNKFVVRFAAATHAYGDPCGNLCFNLFSLHFLWHGDACVLLQIDVRIAAQWATTQCL